MIHSETIRAVVLLRRGELMTVQLAISMGPQNLGQLDATARPLGSEAPKGVVREETEHVRAIARWAMGYEFTTDLWH